MNFFKLYIGDYQRDTAHLSITEHGAYMLMLQHYYATEKPLPIGKALHRMLRAQDKAERDAIDSVASKFWHTTDDGLVNHRADAEITKAAVQGDTNARIAREREAKRKVAREQNEQSTNRANGGFQEDSKNTEKMAEKSKKTCDGYILPSSSEVTQVIDLIDTASHDSCTHRATNDQPNHSHSQTPDLNTERERRASRLPSNFELPDDWKTWCAENRPDLDPASVFDKFRDYWVAKSGKEAAKRDWLATWRNWCREEREKPGHRGQRTEQKSFAQQDREAGWKRWEEMTGEDHPERIKAQSGHVIDMPATATLLEVRA